MNEFDINNINHASNNDSITNNTLIKPKFNNLIKNNFELKENVKFKDHSNKEKNNADISVDKLITDEVKDNTSVGLDMNKLIKNNSENNVNTEPIETKFNNLVSDFVPNYDTKFGVQPIPIDMDRSMLPKPVDKEDLHINNDDKPIGRKINNWFTRIIDQKGENYFVSGRLTAEEVSKNAERILDDMISGRVDYDKFGTYITMPVIIDTLINYCSNKLAINKALQFSLGYTYNDYMSRTNLINDYERYNTLIKIDESLIRDITQSIAIVNQDIAIYSILFNKLSYTNATKNASNLYSIINELNSYKKRMKKRY